MIALDVSAEIVWTDDNPATEEALAAAQDRFAEYFLGYPWEELLPTPEKKGRFTISQETIAEILEMAEAGICRAEIARALGLSWHQVDQYTDRKTVKRGKPGRKKTAKTP